MSATSAPICFAFGSRSFKDADLLHQTLSALGPFRGLWSGAARGADTLAATWARAMQIPVREWEADWARQGRRAGLARSRELIAALPPDAVCVCFLPHNTPYPGRDAIVRAGGARTFLSPGSRASCGYALERGLLVWLVWSDGSMTRLAPSPGPRPRAWDEPTRSDRLDLADTSTTSHEEGWEQPKHNPYWMPARAAKTTRKIGDRVTIDGREYVVREISPDRTSVRMVPVDAPQPSGDLPPDENDILASHAFGDHERRHQATLETRRRFIPTGNMIVCRCCGDQVEHVRGAEELCAYCLEQIHA